MQLFQYEQALLSAVLRYPESIKVFVGELGEDKFSYGRGGLECSAHRLIYQAASELYLNGIPPDSISVERQLGERLELVGGTAYLRELLQALPLLGIRTVTESSLRAWAQVVDNMGRLRHLASVVEKYADLLKDREKALSEIEDLDIFISGLIGELSEAQGLISRNYQPISSGIGSLRRRLEREFRGYSIQIPEIGWPSFRSANLPFLGGLTIIAGLSGSGKTQLALQILLGQLIQNRLLGIKGCAAINSYEMKDWRLASRLACCLARVDSSVLRTGGILDSSDEAKNVLRWLDFIEELPIFIDDSNLTTPSKLNWQVSALHATQGPLVNLVIDYAEQVPMSEAEERQSRDRQVGAVFQNAVNIAKSTGAAVHVISQYNQSVLFSKYKIAGPAALRYGQAGWQLADVLIELWNPISMKASQISFALPDGLTDNQAWIFVEKYRDGPEGMKFPLNWEPQYTRFSDPLITHFGAGLYEGLEEDF